MESEGKLTKEAIGYIVCNCMMKIIELFVSTFLVSYLLTISNGNMFNVALYYIIYFLGVAIFYSLFSCFLHKTSKLLFYRIGIVLKGLFLISISLLKENVTEYVIPVALFYGISSGAYWSSYNVMKNEAISSKSVQKFYGLYNIWGYIVNIVAPIALGSIIDAGSFIKTAIYAFFVCVILFISSFLLVSRKEEGNKLVFKEFIKTVKKDKQEKAFIECYLLFFFHGLASSTSTLITIMIVLTFNSNVSLGSLSSIMAIISIFITFAFMKKYDYKKSKIIFLCLVLCLIGVGGLVINISKPMIVLFNVLYTIAMIIPDNIRVQKRIGIIRITKKLKFALEHNVIAEIFLNVGRIVSYVSLLIGSFINSLSVYKVLLVVNLFFICLYCFLSYKMEKKYSGIIFKNDVLKHLKEVEIDRESYLEYEVEEIL